MTTKSSNTICVIPNCSSKKGQDKNVSFHEFPADFDLRQKWIENLPKPRKGGQKWLPDCDRSLICGLHFFDTDFTITGHGHKRLVKGSVPSKFPNCPNYFKNVNLKRKSPPSKMSNELQQQLPSKIAKSVINTDDDMSNTIGASNAEILDLKLKVEEQAKTIESQAREILKYKKIIADHLITIESLRTEIKSLKVVKLQDHGFEIEPEFDLFSPQPSPAAELQNDNVKMSPEQVQKLIQECKSKKLVISIKKLPVMHYNSKFKLIPLAKTLYAGNKLNKPRKRGKPKLIKSTPSKEPPKITGNPKAKYSFICTYCPEGTSTKTFKSKKGLISHISTFHPDSEIPPEIYICSEPGCGDSFTQILDYNTHLNIHKEKKFKCTDCEVCFAQIRQLWRHRKSEHYNNKSVFCDKCGKTLRDKDGLKRHLRAVHENYRPHFCSSCPKSFTRLSALKIHEETHMSNLSIKCRYQNCDMIFKSRSSRNDHIYRSHLHDGKKLKNCNYINPNKPKPCPHCGKVLKTQMTLRLHILRFHKKLERQFKCDFPECGWSFRFKADLRNHKKVHMSIQEQTVLKLQKKKAICELCGITVNQPNLKKHMKGHENNTGPWACSIDNCWRRYENERSLKIHQRNHYNPNPKMNFKSGAKISKNSLHKMLNNSQPSTNTDLE